MRRTTLVPFLSLALLLAPSLVRAVAPGPYYARGDFYVAPGSPGSAGDGTWGWVPELQLFDDGLHDDGLAAGGIYATWVTTNTVPGYHEFKIANSDWTFAEPSVAAAALVNGRLYTTHAGEVVQFRLDLSAPPGNWMPAIAVANDHGYPAGAQLEVIGSAPELGTWNFGLPADLYGDVWSKSVEIATPGYYEYKFRVVGSWRWANFGLNYNNNFGYNAYFFTTIPNEIMTIQFDARSGRLIAFSMLATPARRASWGAIKAGYR